MVLATWYGRHSKENAELCITLHEVCMNTTEQHNTEHHTPGSRLSCALLSAWLSARRHRSAHWRRHSADRQGLAGAKQLHLKPGCTLMNCRHWGSLGTLRGDWVHSNNNWCRNSTALCRARVACRSAHSACCRWRTLSLELSNLLVQTLNVVDDLLQESCSICPLSMRYDFAQRFQRAQPHTG